MGNKYLAIVFIIFLCSCKKNNTTRFDIEQRTDSLFYFLEEANNDLLKYDSRHLCAQKALAILSKEKNDSLNRVNYFKVANRFFNMNAMEDYKNTTEKIIENSEKAKDSFSLAKAYSYLGDYYGSKFVSENAYQAYFNAERIYRKLNLDANIAKTLLNKSVLQLNEKDYVGSEKSALESLKFLRKVHNDELTYETFNILGIIYHELEEYDKALEFHDKALKIAESGNLPTSYQSKTTSLNNIGIVYQREKKYKEALVYYTKALKEKEVFEENPLLYASLKNNFAYSKFKIGDNKELPELFYEALKIRDSLKIVIGIASSKINLSEYYAFQNDTVKSKKFAQEAYAISKNHNLPNVVLLSLKQLSAIDPKNTVKYSEEYLSINDSLQLAERQIRNKLARIEFETEELVIQKDRLVEQRKNIIYSALGIILIGILIYIIRFQNAKNRELRLIQEQQNANEEIYQLMITQQNKIEEVRQSEKKKIAQELHDGVLGKMFGTRINLGQLNNSSTEQAISKRNYFLEELQNIEQDIREISHDLNSEKTAIFNNFVIMISNLIENQRVICQGKINYYMSQAIDWTLVENVTKINLYRILQESFQNINKYSKASKVLVTFAIQDNIIILRVEDDGIGFDVTKKKKGIGLQNMKTRIHASNGIMKVDSEVGAGTLITFEIPINIPNQIT